MQCPLRVLACTTPRRSVPGTSARCMQLAGWRGVWSHSAGGGPAPVQLQCRMARAALPGTGLALAANPLLHPVVQAVEDLDDYAPEPEVHAYLHSRWVYM